MRRKSTSRLKMRAPLGRNIGEPGLYIDVVKSSCWTPRFRWSGGILGGGDECDEHCRQCWRDRNKTGDGRDLCRLRGIHLAARERSIPLQLGLLQPSTLQYRQRLNDLKGSFPSFFWFPAFRSGSQTAPHPNWTSVAYTFCDNIDRPLSRVSNNCKGLTAQMTGVMITQCGQQLGASSPQ